MDVVVYEDLAKFTMEITVYREIWLINYGCRGLGRFGFLNNGCSSLWRFG